MADFIWVPNYTLGRDSKWNTLISEGETGKEILRSKRSTPVYGFSLDFTNPGLIISAADAMLAFFDNKKGAGTWFTWEHPDSHVVYTVRFLDDQIKQGYYMYGRYNCQVNFRVKTI